LNLKDHEVSVTTDFLERFLDSFERWSALFFDWAGNHPYEFGALLAFLGYLAYLYNDGHTKRKSMEIAYRERREAARTEPELPLPPPVPRLPKPGFPRQPVPTLPTSEHETGETE
jgi:hypothetical protein